MPADFDVDAMWKKLANYSELPHTRRCRRLRGASYARGVRAVHNATNLPGGHNQKGCAVCTSPKDNERATRSVVHHLVLATKGPRVRRCSHQAARKKDLALQRVASPLRNHRFDRCTAAEEFIFAQLSIQRLHKEQVRRKAVHLRHLGNGNNIDPNREKLGIG